MDGEQLLGDALETATRRRHLILMTTGRAPRVCRLDVNLKAMSVIREVMRSQSPDFEEDLLRVPAGEEFMTIGDGISVCYQPSLNSDTPEFRLIIVEDQS